MPYYCESCGEEDEFYGDQDYTETGSRRVYMDSEGGIDDYGDTNDSDIEGGDINCAQCHACDSPVSWFEDDVVEKMIKDRAERLEKQLEENSKITDWKSVIQGVIK